MNEELSDAEWRAANPKLVKMADAELRRLLGLPIDEEASLPDTAVVDVSQTVREPVDVGPQS